MEAKTAKVKIKKTSAQSKIARDLSVKKIPVSPRKLSVRSSFSVFLADFKAAHSK